MGDAGVAKTRQSHRYRNDPAFIIYGIAIIRNGRGPLCYLFVALIQRCN